MAAPKLIDANPPYLSKTGVKSSNKYTNVFVLDPEGDTIDPGALSAEVSAKIEAASPLELLRMILIELSAMHLAFNDAFELKNSPESYRETARQIVE